MRIMLGTGLIIAVFVPGMIITAAQNQPLAFEVVSVKPVKQVVIGGGQRGLNGVYRAEFMTFKTIASVPSE